MLLDIIENIPMLIIPIYTCLLIGFALLNVINRKNSSIESIKFIFCLGINIILLLGVLIIMIMQIYQMALIWKEYELTQAASPLTKSVSFMLIEVVWWCCVK